jgi:FAD:protein FMN transferase
MLHKFNFPNFTTIFSMDNRRKNLVYSALLLSAVFIVYKWRNAEATDSEPVKIEGRTMGTTYHITYFDEKKRNFSEAVDSLLREVNRSINTYDSTSEVSIFNRSVKGIAVKLPYLVPPLEVAREVYAYSNGAFDPTVMPLVNALGFGPAKRIRIDSAEVDSIKSFIGFEKVVVRADSVLKSDARIQLDFGGIGQGFGADVICDFLKKKGINNMLVELGGEGMAVGKNLKTGKDWQIGILDPNSTSDQQYFKAYVSITNRSFTTSGNYFNFHEENGVKYSHTIDPSTGFPARKAILSASVFTTNCTLADAWATAMMVVGHDEAIKLAEKHPELDVLLFYSDENGRVKSYTTPRISANVVFEKDK